MLLKRLFARASEMDAQRESRHIAAARRLSRAAVRILVLLYITGAVLLLPGLQSNRTTRASSDGAQAISGIVSDDRTTVSAHAVATVDRTDQVAVRSYVASASDGPNMLDAIAKRFAVKPETLAYNNGITSRAQVYVGETLRIPAVDGVIYEVKDGDTIDAVAAKFGVDAKAILDANRLYFEPQNFAPGKEVLVPVPSASFPDFALDAVARVSTVARGSSPAAPAAPAGIVTAPVAHRLQWPVGGVITQGYWAGHLGVDIAAPYGTPIGASDAGVVSAVGWVAIGGLRVCVAHDWGMTTCYYHTSATYVYVGQRVARGQVVAAIGLTGVTTGPHVHWEANLNGVLVNALAY
ncbi:MAG: M23 family metallopeptidase [Chloroflexi bacterium]|nr:MAG: M23 family metallopeptidase [Chloroflexota bacterium]